MLALVPAAGALLTLVGCDAASRRARRRGQQLFPASQELAARLAIAQRALVDHVEEQRNLEQAIDTDRSFVPVPHSEPTGEAP